MYKARSVEVTYIKGLFSLYKARSIEVTHIKGLPSLCRDISI